MRGKTSEAAKRRKAMQAAGAPPLEQPNPRRVISGLMGAIAKHGPDKVGTYLINQSHALSTSRDLCTSIAAEAAPLVMARMVDLALGRGDFQRAPVGEQRQAGQYVLGVAGVKPEVDKGPGDTPANELTLAAIEQRLRELDQERAKRLAEPVEWQASVDMPPQPADSPSSVLDQQYGTPTTGGDPAA